MDYMSTDFGADSSSRFPFRVWANRKTDRQTRLNALPHAGGYTAGVGNKSYFCSHYSPITGIDGKQKGHLCNNSKRATRVVIVSHFLAYTQHTLAYLYFYKTRDNARRRVALNAV